MVECCRKKKHRERDSERASEQTRERREGEEESEHEREREREHERERERESTRARASERERENLLGNRVHDSGSWELSSRQHILNLVSVQRWLHWAQRGRLHEIRIRTLQRLFG